MQGKTSDEFPSLAELNSSKKEIRLESISSKEDLSKKKLNSINSDFGMHGLMSQIKHSNAGNFNSRSASTINNKNQNNYIFAPGIELTHLGVNLDCPSQMFTTFASPFAESPYHDLPLDAFIPSEYNIVSNVNDNMARLKVETIPEETLFFLFYTKPYDYLQLVASTALHKIGWKFEKSEKKWIKKIGENKYQVFTPEKWQTQYMNSIEWTNLEHEPPLTYEQIENLWLGPNNQLLQKLPK